MKVSLATIHNINRKITKIQHFLENPFEQLLDFIIRAIVSLLIPIPLAAEVIVQFKWIILPIILNGILLVIVLIISLPMILVSNNFTVQANTNSNTKFQNNSNINSTNIPKQNPLGGEGLSMVKITAGYMDPNYTFFGGAHTGVDFIPNDLYYQTNKTYKDTGNIVVYETMNGTVNYYVDEFGSNTVEVVNKENTVKVIDMHLNSVLVQKGQEITAGTPVGTMGDTGFSTGEHLHYEIRINNNGIWTPINPLDYIQ